MRVDFLQRVIWMPNSFVLLLFEMPLKCLARILFYLCKMERFLTTKSKPKKERHLPVNITAGKKARQYQRGTFHASENLSHLQCCVRSFKEICGRCRNLLAAKSKNKIYKPYLHWFSEMNIGETWSFWLPSTWAKVSSKKKKQIVDIFGQKLIWWEVCSKTAWLQHYFD